jgi:hypothetical protein
MAKKLFLFFLLLCLIHFWGFVYVPAAVHNVTNDISLLIMGLCFLKTGRYNGLQFKNSIILFFIGLIINIISAYMNQGQAPLETFLNLGPTYFMILFYFYLHYQQPSRKFMEWIILIFAVLFSLFYVFQFLAYPDIIFNGEMFEDRGTIRIRIEGGGFLMLAYFLLLNRYFLGRRLIDLLFAFGFFIILLLDAFRTLTIAALLLSVIMFMKFARYSVKNYALLLVLALFVLLLFKYPPTSNILNNMISSTIEQKEEGRDYIRLRELSYFFNIYPQNVSYFLMGGGFPGSESNYAHSMQTLNLEDRFYWTDLGLMGFYIVIGPVALIGLLWYTIKAIFKRTHPNQLYINFYFAFLLLVSITTREIYREGIFVVVAICLYLIDLSCLEESIIPEID